MRQPGWLLLAAALTACGGTSSDGAGRLGVEGASCLRTADCEPPLQCIATVCTALGDGGATARDAVADVPLVFGDGHASGDARDVAAEGPGDAPAGPDSGDASDAGAPSSDTIYQPFDVGPDWTPAGPDIELNAPDTFTGCGELGIASAWSGGFDGEILFWDVEAPPGLEGQVPESGTLEVYGDLSFEIRCLEQKLIVSGTLSGFGEAVGEAGSHPFTAEITGEYDPRTDAVTTTIDGSVRLFYIFEIYFEGDLNGALSGPERFDGDWAGMATGNNLNLRGEAAGGGEWWATGP